VIKVLWKICREQTQTIERITYVETRIVGIGCCGARSGECSSIGNRRPSCGVFGIGSYPGSRDSITGRLGSTDSAMSYFLTHGPEF
jgi:hypothetical protein